MRTINRRIVAAYIISADGKLLLGRKDPKRGGVYADYWHNPGGGVDAGETDEQALRREIMEETGIDLRAAKLTLIDDQGHGESVRPLPDGEKVLAKMQFNIYKAELPQHSADVKLAPSDDLIDFKWVPVADAPTAGLTPPALELFARIGTDWLTATKGA